MDTYAYVHMPVLAYRALIRRWHPSPPPIPFRGFLVPWLAPGLFPLQLQVRVYAS